MFGEHATNTFVFVGAGQTGPRQQYLFFDPEVDRTLLPPVIEQGGGGFLPAGLIGVTNDLGDKQRVMMLARQRLQCL